MRASDLTDTGYGEGKAQRQQCLKFKVFCLFVGAHFNFCNFSVPIRWYSYQKKKKSQPPINPLLFLWIQPQWGWCNTHLFLCHLSLVSTHVMYIPSQVWLRWFSQADARPGVFSRSLSLVAVTQEALWFHYPAFPRQLLDQTEVLREYRCRIIAGPELYESMEHAANITPCNTLPRQHPHICP